MFRSLQIRVCVNVIRECWKKPLNLLSTITVFYRLGAANVTYLCSPLHIRMLYIQARGNSFLVDGTRRRSLSSCYSASCLYSASTLVGVYTFRSSDRPVGPTGLSDWSVRRSYRVKFDSSTVCPTVGRSVYTIRSSDRPVGQTSRTDRSVRRSERVNAHLSNTSKNRPREGPEAFNEQIVCYECFLLWWAALNAYSSMLTKLLCRLDIDLVELKWSDHRWRKVENDRDETYVWFRTVWFRRPSFLSL